MTKIYPRARIKVRDEEEFRRRQKLVEKVRQRREREAATKDDLVILSTNSLKTVASVVVRM